MKDKYYYKDGTTSSGYYDTSKKLHRENGPACEYTDGDREWYVDGKPHRVDGPAIEHSNGTKSWWVDGECHRIDGPAIEYNDGAKYWYVDGKYYSKKDFNKLIEEVKKLPLALRLIDPREWVRKL